MKKEDRRTAHSIPPKLAVWVRDRREEEEGFCMLRSWLILIQETALSLPSPSPQASQKGAGEESLGMSRLQREAPAPHRTLASLGGS